MCLGGGSGALMQVNTIFTGDVKKYLNKFTNPHAGSIIDGAEDHRDNRRTSNFNGGRPFW